MSILSEFIGKLEVSPLGRWAHEKPWTLTTHSEDIVRKLLLADMADYRVQDEIAIHETAKVEPNAVIKRPAIIGPGCFVGTGSYLRGGVWLDENCIIGPGSELKSSFVFAGSKLAHFNFVGDSLLGEGVNLEAGSIIANYRNENTDKEIVLRWRDRPLRTGVDKFGALLGDGVRVGANAVVAPGALIDKGFVVPRLGLVDQARA